MNCFAKNLKELRKKNNLSQENLATILGYERQTISLWENKNREPGIDTLIGIANYFKISVDELINDKETGKVDPDNNHKIEKRDMEALIEQKEEPFMSDEELKEFFDIKTDRGNEILGTYNGKTVSVPKKYNKFINNEMIIGRPGTGKTQFLINKISQIIKRGESVIIADKGDIYNHTATLFKHAGYNIKVFNPSNYPNTDYWNVFGDSFLTVLGNRYSEEKLEMYYDFIIQKQKQDISYIDMAARKLFFAVILSVALEDKNDKKTDSICKITTLFEKDDKWLNDYFLRLIPEFKPCKKHWFAFTQFSDDVRIAAKIFVAKKFREFINNKWTLGLSEIDLSLPTKEKCAYFYVVPVSTEDNSSAFIDIMLDVTKNETEKNTNVIPVNFLFDEFTNIKTLKNIVNITASNNQYIKTAIVLQNIVNFKKCYPNSWANILLNSTLMFFSRLSLEETTLLKNIGLYKDMMPKDRNYMVIYLASKPMHLEKICISKNQMFHDLEKKNIREYNNSL